MSTFDSVTLSPCQIHHFQEKQSDERQGSFGTLNERLAFMLDFHDGWRPGEVILVRKATDADKKKAVKQRQKSLAFWNSLEGSVPYGVDSEGKPLKVQYSTLAKHYAAIYTDPPEYIGVSGYRRGSVLHALDWVASEGLQIHAVLTTVKNPEDEFAKRIQENTQPHRAQYSYEDSLVLAVKCLKYGWDNARTNRSLHLKAGKGKQIYALATLATRYPKLDIVKRVRMEKPDPLAYSEGGYIPLQRLDKDVLGGLVCRTPSDNVNATVKELLAIGHKGDGPIIHKPANATQVEAYFKKAIEEGRSADRIMQRSTFQTLRDGSPPDSRAYQLLNGILTNGIPTVGAILAELRALPPLEVIEDAEEGTPSED